MMLFVMTGATVPFDALLDAFDESLLAELKRLGYSELVVQYGHAAEAWARLEARAPWATGFSRSLDLQSYLDRASLVVCPAGAGSILDVLRRPAPPKLVCCVNSGLMDNHQTEIARHLHPNYLIMCEPTTVAAGVARASDSTFHRLPPQQSLQSVYDSSLESQE